MSRSKWKGPFVNFETRKLVTQVEKKTQNDKIQISRNSSILPNFIDSTFLVYNGKNNVELIVTEDMVGHKFGEFSFTRAKFIFKKKKKKKK